MPTGLDTYYGGMTLVDNIPQNQRLYDRPTAMLTRIEYGRATMMRVLLNMARSRGAYVANDVKTYWGLEHNRTPKVDIADNAASTSGSKYDKLKITNENAARLQAGDLLTVKGTYTSPDRSASPVDALTSISTKMMPEMIEVNEVGAPNSAGSDQTIVWVRRNHGGGEPTTPAQITSSMYLVKSLNSQGQGLDDFQIYSDTDDEDFNYCQIAGKKWGATETEQNIQRAYTDETAFQRNGRRALEEFFLELDYYALIGARTGPKVVNGRKKWYAGGLMEFIPSNNWIGYTNTLFSTKNFNTEFKDKFYYGSQNKIMVCGADWYTKFSNMLDNKIQLNSVPNSWGLELVEYRITNGGVIYVTPSDTLSLYGLSDAAILLDPEHFKYGHLNNMNINTRDITSVNPHEETKEIYGQFTFKRTNPYAHWVFRYDG